MPKILTWTLSRRLCQPRSLSLDAAPGGSMRAIAPLIALIHAPVLGPSSWLPVAGVAARAGWPVLDLPGGHLHMLVSPGEVAAAITGLAEEARAADASLGSLP
jgi:hypothetical protein